MWGVLLVPSWSPTLSPIYDGLDVNVTSNVTWFHLNHMTWFHVESIKLSFYGGHSITITIALKIRKKENSAFSSDWASSTH